MQIRSLIIFLFTFVVTSAACSGGGSSTKPPDAKMPDAFDSTCGMPGDTGNEMGVGKFCAQLTDCTNPSAGLCSSLGDPTTHFCTHTCKAGDPATVCGTGAECVCNASNQCGCTPSKCLH
jgi:hypothetical protein